MTPTLSGRWQTRIFLMSTLGALITIGFGYLFNDYQTPFVILGYVALFGLAWDVVFNGLQKMRWEGDWPPVFFLAAGIWEGLFMWAVLQLTPMLGGAPLLGVAAGLTLWQFVAHYATVWVVLFFTMHGPMRIAFPHWRFQGGQIL